MPGLLDFFCGCESLTVGSSAAPVAGTVPIRPEVEPARTSSVSFVKGTDCNVVPACFYQADTRDPVDTQLAELLMGYDQSCRESLWIGRVRPGEYELGGRRVKISQATGLYGGRDELVVREQGEAVGNVDGGAGTPLSIYLRQVADVAAHLAGCSDGAPAVARVPTDQRLTFAPLQTPVSSDPVAERVRSMRVACEQARLREHAAEEYHHRGRPKPKLLACQGLTTPTLTPVSCGGPLPLTRANSCDGLGLGSGKPQIPLHTPGYPAACSLQGRSGQGLLQAGSAPQAPSGKTTGVGSSPTRLSYGSLLEARGSRVPVSVGAASASAGLLQAGPAPVAPSGNTNGVGTSPAALRPDNAHAGMGSYVSACGTANPTSLGGGCRANRGSHSSSPLGRALPPPLLPRENSSNVTPVLGTSNSAGVLPTAGCGGVIGFK
eukprot:TRINITY_DN32778_c0_g1_i1.p1 TRINITY_DN32778_c0_g1~~TRINITY_DN32778_c0_g1_i1.p1  ORF type:complete len:435 (-),score=34.98 TRINITY_DN32778_c0_g1_i1:35-1339(-)